MPTILEFRVTVTIQATGPADECTRTVLLTRAYSTDDAGRRVITALNLIDEAKEKANEPAGDSSDKHS